MLVVAGLLFRGQGSAGSGPGDGDGFGVDDVGAEVAIVLGVVSLPSGGDLLAVAEDLDVFEDNLLAGRIVAAFGVLLEDNIKNGEVLILSLRILLHGNNLRRGDTSVQVGLGDGVGLLVFTEEGHLTTELVATLSGLLLGVVVVFGRPLEVLSVEVPRRAQPGVDGLDEVEVVSGVGTDPGRVEGVGGLGSRGDGPGGFVVGHAGASGAVGGGPGLPSRGRVLLETLFDHEASDDDQESGEENTH